jgi:hypothetical protein
MKKIILIFTLLILQFTFKNENCFGQWEQMANGLGVNAGPSCFVACGNDIYIGTSDVVIQPAGVYMSTNNGELWIHNSLPYLTVGSLAINGNRIFAGILSNGVCYTDNFGANWNGTSLYNRNAGSIKVSGNNIFAISGSVYISTNNGVNWTSTGLNYGSLSTLEISGNSIYAGGDVNFIPPDNGGIWLSSNNGGNWTRIMYDQSVLIIAVSGNNIFAGTRSHGIYLSTNNGSNWAQIAFSNCMITSLAINGNNIFTGVNNNNGIYLSTDNGVSWIQKNQGFGTGALPQIGAFFFKNNYIFVTTSASVWRRGLSEILAVESTSTEVPTSFSLSQNYPNPFNPGTKIKFQIKDARLVTLKVYDIFGKEVTTLVNGKLKAGEYDVTFNGSGLPSGIYIYKLTAGDFKAAKKMILVK